MEAYRTVYRRPHRQVGVLSSGQVEWAQQLGLGLAVRLAALAESQQTYVVTKYPLDSAYWLVSEASWWSAVERLETWAKRASRT